MLGGGEALGLIEGGLQFEPMDFDVGDIQLVACEFGTEDDEAPVPIGRQEPFGITFREEAVFALLKMIAKTSFKDAREGKASIR